MGYRFFRFLLPIWAFFVGISFGVESASNFFSSTFLGISGGLIIGFILGVIFALLAYFVYELAIVLFGGYLGYMLVQGIFLMFGVVGGFIPLVLGLIVGTTLAVLFAKLSVLRLLIVVGTALGGSVTVISGVLALFGKVNPSVAILPQTNAIMDNSWFWPFTWILLACLGIAVQYILERNINMMEAYVIEPVSVSSTTEDTA